jgi:REP element-mobilizing transposase RayT
VLLLPRIARIKFNNANYHIMMRSISELPLFRNNKDKEKFLEILSKYKNMFMFNVLAYCLMDTHVHLLIYANGADISKFMHAINQSYAQYYNKKYNRHGHVFADRFKSKIAKKDFDILNISAYIHNNPKDIRGYRNCVENYKYSSFGIYIGKIKNNYNIIDTNFLLNYYGEDPILCRKRYFKFVKQVINSDINQIDINEFEFINAPSKYISGKEVLLRNMNPQTIINFICKNLNTDYLDIYIKYKKSTSDLKALCVFILRGLCDYKLTEISSFIRNLTLSSLSKLCSKGYDLVKSNSNYRQIINKLVKQYGKTYVNIN